MTSTRRGFNQQTLHIDDTIMRIKREDIGNIIADIEKDQRLKLQNTHLNPTYPDAERYEITAEFTPGETKSVATALRCNAVYMVSLNTIPQRDYEEGSEERRIAEAVIGGLKEIFRRYRA